MLSVEEIKAAQEPLWGKFELRSNAADWWYLEGYGDVLRGHAAWDEFSQPGGTNHMAYQLGYKDAQGDLERKLSGF